MSTPKKPILNQLKNDEQSELKPIVQAMAALILFSLENVDNLPRLNKKAIEKMRGELEKLLDEGVKAIPKLSKMVEDIASTMEKDDLKVDNKYKKALKTFNERNKSFDKKNEAHLKKTGVSIDAFAKHLPPTEPTDNRLKKNEIEAYNTFIDLSKDLVNKSQDFLDKKAESKELSPQAQAARNAIIKVVIFLPRVIAKLAAKLGIYKPKDRYTAI